MSRPRIYVMYEDLQGSKLSFLFLVFVLHLFCQCFCYFLFNPLEFCVSATACAAQRQTSEPPPAAAQRFARRGRTQEDDRFAVRTLTVSSSKVGTSYLTWWSPDFFQPIRDSS